MTSRKTLGGVIHTYQRYDPKNFPSPTQPPPDLVSPAFEHLLAYGSMRHLTEEELANAIRLDPSQIAGLGPSIDYLLQLLRERKEKILATYETDRVRERAGSRYREMGNRMKAPAGLRPAFQQAFKDEQLRELERLWYRAGDERSQFSRQLVQLVDALGDKYQVDELAAKYAFTGRERMTIPQALAIKEELETIDRLLEQLEEAAKTAQIGLIDMEELSRFAQPGDLNQLEELRQQIEDYMREAAQRQGLKRGPDGMYQLTPQAYKIFQGKLLQEIFSELEASRTGRHTGPIVGEGAVELQRTKPYEFGDPVASMDIPTSLVNALLRSGPGLPVRMKSDDIEVHRTRNTPKCATAVLMDMSGSMRYDGQYINVKRMALALDGLIRREYPGDFLQFIEIFTFAKPRQRSEIAELMPKPVTMFDPVIRLKADMSDPDISEVQIPPHFTNLQHGLQLARRYLSTQDTPNRQIILITDGLPTAHFEGEMLYLLYPPHPATEKATLREGLLCQREHITINVFLLPSWSQSSEDVQFAYRLAESTSGRVFFTGGKDLDRYVVWDYVSHRRKVIG
ncbi:MAG: hypothetical protein KF708_22365 [Pirellulales bacterium]|nr:hypothetical protein [Pirellulales bacterium]